MRIKGVADGHHRSVTSSPTTLYSSLYSILYSLLFSCLSGVKGTEQKRPLFGFRTCKLKPTQQKRLQRSEEASIDVAYGLCHTQNLSHLVLFHSRLFASLL